MKGREGPALVLALILTGFAAPARGQRLKPFTVAEGIALARFNTHYYNATNPLASPDGRFLAVWAERGLVDKNLVEDELRVYDRAALEDFLEHASQVRAPAPVLDLREATYQEGPIVSHIRWLRDSTKLAFLLRDAQGKNQLEIIGLQQTRPRQLSLQGQNITAFDVRDPTHYVYTVMSGGWSDRGPAGRNGWTTMVGTGRSLESLLLPAQVIRAKLLGTGVRVRSVLWAAVGAAPRCVTSRKSRQPIVIYGEGQTSLALSPSGYTLATALAVPQVPKGWEREFLPPYPGLPYHLRPGRQDLTVPFVVADSYVSEYVLIDLRSGEITPVNGAPTGSAAGWYALARPAWSDDGKALLLPDAFQQPAQANRSSGRPCVAVFYPAVRTMRCVEPLKALFTKSGGPEPGYYMVSTLRFADHGSDKFIIDTSGFDGKKGGPAKVFVRRAAGGWQAAGEEAKPGSPGKLFDVDIRQGLNERPRLVVSDLRTTASRVVWDPNPQLHNIALGQASLYRWKDSAGREWTGGLYKPPNDVAGRRYPLVIQTHDFLKDEFRPSGIYPTAFAARALAARGIMVLQASMCPVMVTPEEGPCNVAGYQSAVTQLASQGLIDPNRVGIIGFSRSVYHVLEALTTSRLRFAAASVTDGVDEGYWQYLVTAGAYQGSLQHDADAVIGAKPFGPGLPLWLKRSPEFNMEKVDTPLLVVALGRDGLLYMWDPYALLRLLDKPVDLQVLNSDEHVLTNPAVRLASQSGSVDWFRFWLEGYEDPDPAKTPQYRRWEKLCDMQRAQNPADPAFCVPTNRRPLRPAHSGGPR